MRVLLRLLVVLVGFLAACLVISILLHIRWGYVVPRLGWGKEWHLAIVWVAGMCVLLAALPAGIALIVLEQYDLRRWFHAATAGFLVTVCAGATLIAMHPGVRSGARPFLPPLDMYTIDVLLAGAVGGLVYWLIAGRSSGATLPGR